MRHVIIQQTEHSLPLSRVNNAVHAVQFGQTNSRMRINGGSDIPNLMPVWGDKCKAVGC